MGNNCERSYRLWEIVKPTVFPIPADPSTLGGIDPRVLSISANMGYRLAKSQ